MNYKALIIKKAAESEESQKKHDGEHLEVIEELGDLAMTTLEIRENVIDHAISDTNNDKVKEKVESMKTSNYRQKIVAKVDLRPLEYEQKFFAQGEEADEYINLLEKKGPSALIGYLNDAGALQGEGEMSDKPHHGSNDYIKKFKDGWIVSWNYGIPYVGVEFVHSAKTASLNPGIKTDYRQRIAGLMHKDELIKMVNSFDAEQLKSLANLYEIEPRAALQVCLNHLNSGYVDPATAGAIIKINKRMPYDDSGRETAESYSNYRQKITKAQEGLAPIEPRQKIPYEVWIKSKRSDGITYEQWKRRVDKLISKQFGLGMDDFPDWRSMDAYEGNKTVEQGFRAFKRAQGSELFASNYRKKITARLKRASMATEGEKLIEDKEVIVDGVVYSVDAMVSYGADYEPESGDGWNEPREGGYYSVGIDLESLKATGEHGEITDPEFLARIRQAFMAKYSDSIEEDISNELMESAKSDAEEPDFDPRDDYDDRDYDF